MKRKKVAVNILFKRPGGFEDEQKQEMVLEKVAEKPKKITGRKITVVKWEKSEDLRKEK
jgi:hypothetical protein